MVTVGHQEPGGKEQPFDFVFWPLLVQCALFCGPNWATGASTTTTVAAHLSDWVDWVDPYIDRYLATMTTTTDETRDELLVSRGYVRWREREHRDNGPDGSLV